jgi:imidazolonepropionase-like amidohydrolase
MIIICDKIYLSAERFICGKISVEDGKICAISEMPAEKLENHAADIDARGLLLYPGFIDAHSHIGMIGSGVGLEGDDINEDSDPVTPHLRSIDALDPFDSAFTDAVKAGITASITGSGSANAIGGDLIAIKCNGQMLKIADEMLIRRVGIKFALGENPKSVHGDKDSPPVTRMGTAALIREALAKARRYMDDIQTASLTDDDPPEFDMKSDALIPLLKREIKAHFHCHKACDIATAIRIAEEFDLDYVLIHCSEGYLIADYLAQRHAAAIVGPIITGKTKPELANFSEKNAGILSRSGVDVAVCTDHPEMPEHYLRLSAEIAGENGLPDPITAITSAAARIIGCEDRIGAIKVGLDADFAITDESGKVKFTIINGKVVYKTDDNAE